MSKERKRLMAEALKDDLSQLIGDYSDFHTISPEQFVNRVKEISENYSNILQKIP